MTDVTPPWAAPGYAPGSRVGSYRLEARIGSGGMAVVYRAHDERLDRLVALKVLAPALAEDVAFRHRFTRESRAAAAVEDPNIIPVYEAGEADGVLFIAMRLVRGGTIRNLVGQHGPLAYARAAWIVSAMASALDTAHGAGLVHRDVKPANMLLDERPGRPDHVYLSDFGISKTPLGTSGGLTGTGQFLGTVDYAAPEQILGTAVDGRTDQYALGCSAFELLSGEPPYIRGQALAVVYAHLSDPPPSLAARAAGIPPAVDTVMAKVMAKSPADRYASCQEFADALREALGVQSYADNPTGTQPAIDREPTIGAEPANGGEPRPAGQDTVDWRPAGPRKRAQQDGKPAGQGRPAVPAPPSQPTGDEAAQAADREPRDTEAARAPQAQTEPAAGAPAADGAAEPVTAAEPGSGDAPSAAPGAEQAGTMSIAAGRLQVGEPRQAGEPDVAGSLGHRAKGAGSPAVPTVLVADADVPATTEQHVSPPAEDQGATTIPPGADAGQGTDGTRRGRLRLAIAAAVIVVVGAAAGLLLIGSHPTTSSAPVSYTFPPDRVADGLTLSQVWRLAGHDGNQLTVKITVANPNHQRLSGQLDEPVPAAIKPSGTTISYLPGTVRPRPASGYTTRQWTGLSVNAGKNLVIGYQAAVAPVGTARSRLRGWVNQVRGRVRFTSQLVTTITLKSLRIKPDRVQLVTGTRRKLSLTGQLTNGKSASAAQLAAAVWTSSDRNIASVSPAGIVTALAAGHATIGVAVGHVKASAAVVVTSPVQSTGSQAPPSSYTPPYTPPQSSAPVVTTTAHPLGTQAEPAGPVPSPEPEPNPVPPSVTRHGLAARSASSADMDADEVAGVPHCYLAALNPAPGLAVAAPSPLQEELAGRAAGCRGGRLSAGFTPSGMVAGWPIFLIGVLALLLSVVGLVFRYYRGHHAH